MKQSVFTTERLVIRVSSLDKNDITFLQEIWNLPEVMRFVGFPNGLQITREKVAEQLKNESNKPSLFDKVLIVEDVNGRIVGSCKLGSADEEGIAHTDVKVHPRYWGMKYGQEIKRGLISYHFKNTDCKIVKADPNVKNFASINMQESVGGKRIREFVYEFPESVKHYTEPVHGYIYYVYREDWLKDN